MYTETASLTEKALGEIALLFGDIATSVIVIMCAVLMIALSFYYIADESKYIKDRNRLIEKLQRELKDAERSRTDGYRKNLETSDVADKIFGMYLDEKGRAESNEVRFSEWDKKQVKRIKALEKQLRDNGIEPAKWEDIKVA